MPFRSVATGLALALLAAGCVEELSTPMLSSRPPLVVRPRKLPGPPPAEWSFWEPMEPELHGQLRPSPSLPLEASQVAHPMGGQARWDSLSTEARDTFLKSGVVSGSGARRPSVGGFYAELAEAKVPSCVTVDALFFLVQAAIDRGRAELEAAVIAPALVRFLVRLEERLAAEDRGVPLDLAGPLRLARGVVAVAAALAAPGRAPPRDLAAGVGEELRRIQAHTSVEESPLLGVRLDYTLFAPTGSLGDEAGRARSGLALAASWLAAAPLLLVSRADVEGVSTNVQTARVHARAALLVARLVTPEVDRVLAADYELLRRHFTFVSGPPDDLSPLELAHLAGAAGVPVEEPATLANVAKVDRVRHAALEQRLPGAYDGVADLRVPEGAAGATSSGVGRASLSVRLLGASAPPDSHVLQGLVFPFVGPPLNDVPRATLHGRHRSLPTALDVISWLGSQEAARIITRQGDDAYEGFEKAREQVARLRPEPLAPLRHSSLHMSTLDALSVYLEPSQADLGLPASYSASHAQRKVEVALAVWARLRHDARPFARPGPFAASPALARPKSELRDAPVHVEVHPEVLGRLVSLLRQARRGFASQGLAAGSSGEIVLVEAEEVVMAAYEVATRVANDEAPAVLASAKLASFGARLLWLEAQTGLAQDPRMITSLHIDPVSGRILAAGAASPVELHLALREPRGGRLVHVVGLRIPALELVRPRNRPLDDASFRAELAGGPVESPPFTRSYVTGIK